MFTAIMTIWNEVMLGPFWIRVPRIQSVYSYATVTGRTLSAFRLTIFVCAGLPEIYHGHRPLTAD